VEHFQTGSGDFLDFMMQTDDFNLIAALDNATLNSTGRTVPRPLMLKTSSTGIKNGCPSV